MRALVEGWRQMMSETAWRWPVIIWITGLSLIVAAGPEKSIVWAQQLPIRSYDISDGLANSTVTSIYQDTKGYLWFGTWGGLSRFDGYRFTNYDTRDGLGHIIINDVVEDRRGRLWVATNGGGVARLIDEPEEAHSPRDGEPVPMGRRKFVSYRIGDSGESNQVNALLFDADNTLWCLTDAGLFRAVDSTGDPTFDLILSRTSAEFMLQAALADCRGRLWFGIANGLMQVNQDHMITYGRENQVGRHPIVSIIEDRQGRVLVANRRGAFEFRDSAGGSSRGRWKRVPIVLRSGQEIHSMIADSTGALWIGTNRGLIKYKGGRQTLYTAANGLPGDSIGTLHEDREGNLWMAAAGVCKLSNETIVSFTKAEGLPDQSVWKIIQDREGRIYASTHSGGVVEIVDGKAIPVPGSQAPPFDTIRGRIVQDRQGNWWIGTDKKGLFHFPGPKLQFRHGKRFTAAEGLSGTYVVWIYEDLAGKVWVSMSQFEPHLSNNIYRFDPGRDAHLVFKHIPIQACSPAQVIRMLNDRSGALWLGWHFCLARWAKGTLLVFEPTDGLPEARPRAFLQDSRRWLWIGLRYRGVSVTKDPTAARPTFVNYSIEEGLSSNTIWSIAEGEFGRIYLGTERGLDRLDPMTEQIRHITTRDGLAGDLIRHCMKDRSGNIWVATATGISKLRPRAEQRPAAPPPVYLSRIQIAGEDLSLPEMGTQQPPSLTLSAGQNNLRIEYVGLSFQGEKTLAYQYKLEGADEDWSPPTDERSVHYAQLAPGSYRFLVRAINREGTASSQPAVVSFRILPPIWQRWWFLALGMAMLTGLAYALHRLRLRQVIAMERIRQQIATDLHDDIGSGLSQVAILSEVAKHEASSAGATLLDEVANLARAMRESMSDIVWAVDPRKDRLADLIQRMRQVTFNLLEAEERCVAFQAPEEREIERIGLGPDRRRHLLLIFKEAITNIARHAQAEHVRVEMELEARTLRLTIRDDGRGFDPHAHYEGHGLASLRRRAAALHAALRIDSAPGNGTTIQVVVPLK